MRQRDKEKPNKTTPENTKHPTQEPGEEIYSLEDILAECQTGRIFVHVGCQQEVHEFFEKMVGYDESIGDQIHAAYVDMMFVDGVGDFPQSVRI